jgi:hypothetical protein
VRPIRYAEDALSTFRLDGVHPAVGKAKHSARQAPGAIRLLAECFAHTSLVVRRVITTKSSGGSTDTASDTPPAALAGQGECRRLLLRFQTSNLDRVGDGGGGSEDGRLHVADNPRFPQTSGAISPGACTAHQVLS